MYPRKVILAFDGRLSLLSWYILSVQVAGSLDKRYNDIKARHLAKAWGYGLIYFPISFFLTNTSSLPPHSMIHFFIISGKLVAYHILNCVGESGISEAELKYDY